MSAVTTTGSGPTLVISTITNFVNNTCPGNYISANPPAYLCTNESSNVTYILIQTLVKTYVTPLCNTSSLANTINPYIYLIACVNSATITNTFPTAYDDPTS